MKKLSVLAIALFLVFAGCISDDANLEVLLNRDKEAIENYLQDNAILSVKEFIDEPTGIRVIWQELSESGIKPEIGDTLFVNYTGKLLNNNVFDTSIESVARENNIYNANRPYEPFEVLLGYGQVILGFEFALSIMEEGDKATTLFPSLYGYGSDDGRPDIPRNSPLLFELEIVRIGKITSEDEEDI
ncbi:MAG: FKBP-type peptidyl-prolyl cis-trans isomerase [Mongoliibacter sp.]|uniref:FKBP-type peptidyl-prolyl cis-trans isomerase n=1 Tax=Mongoliibacter sp. TaxID=2022438 RepID=UPI0012F37EB1|nr:FKBP-type peptidyl-prolyl cis-trans isomerase [Mongoliibacter sp.]TVP48641.1 MAG: FKBP-type peptidyl-prolyl cis-trans isomerase [Mongoliibacter sp.]